MAANLAANVCFRIKKAGCTPRDVTRLFVCAIAPQPVRNVVHRRTRASLRLLMQDQRRPRRSWQLSLQPWLGTGQPRPSDGASDGNRTRATNPPHPSVYAGIRRNRGLFSVPVWRYLTACRGIYVGVPTFSAGSKEPNTRRPQSLGPWLTTSSSEGSGRKIRACTQSNRHRTRRPAGGRETAHRKGDRLEWTFRAPILARRRHQRSVLAWSTESNLSS
jgi:hypothetical protein